MAEETGEPPVTEQIRISVFTPLIYVAILLGVFIVFSIRYRRNRLNKLVSIEPIFPDNQPAKIYESLKQSAADPNVAKENKPHDKVLKAALLRRGAEAIRRSMKLKENEPIFNKLYEDGLIGDDVYKQFQIQAKLQEIELKEIVQECETYKKGWVQTFFPTVQEICFNEALRRRLSAIDSRSEEYAKLWEYLVDQSEQPVIKPAPKRVTKEVVKEEKKEEAKEEVKEEKKETEEEAEDDEEGEAEEEESTQEKGSAKKSKKKKGGKGKKK
ncbi:hypothetical protein G9P44_001875 [Scheffersomyces stipitis]|nr:hypothetical protein G9P44_001875 [Scheffersomyces stipitis]